MYAKKKSHLDTGKLCFQHVVDTISATTTEIAYMENGAHIKATNQEGWIKALLSPSIIKCLVQKDGSFSAPLVSNLTNKKIVEGSQDKFERLYSWIHECGEAAIIEQQQHLEMLLKEAHYLFGIGDTKKWDHESGIFKLKHAYESKIRYSLNAVEGERQLKYIHKYINENIAAILISRYSWLFNEREDDPYVEIQKANTIKLLTSMTIIALSPRSDEDEDGTDEIDKLISKYLFGGNSGNDIIKKPLIKEIFSALVPRPLFCHDNIEANTEKLVLEVDSAHPEDIISFFLPKDIAEHFIIDTDVQSLICEGRCSSPECLRQFYQDYGKRLPERWEGVYQHIEANLRRSIDASTYYHTNDKRKPATWRDFDNYAGDRILDKRYGEIWSNIKVQILTTSIHSDFFNKCTFDAIDESQGELKVTQERTLNYIVATILCALFYLDAASSFAAMQMTDIHTTRELYRLNLQKVILKKFPLVSNGGATIGSNFYDKETLDILFKQIVEAYLRCGMYQEMQSNYNDMVNKFGYGDSNDLMPHSHEPTR